MNPHIIKFLVIFILYSPSLYCQTIKLKYEPVYPKLYFQNDIILVETDTTSFMEVVRKKYSKFQGRPEMIKTELDYQINNAQSDSVVFKGFGFIVYLDEKRNSWDNLTPTGILTVELIKMGLVKIYYKDNKQEIREIFIKKVIKRNRGFFIGMNK